VVGGKLWVAALVAAALVAPASASADVVVHAGTGLGEPEIRANPRDPSNLVVGENDTGVSVSRDRGATWKQVALPNNGDNVLAVRPDGTFFYSSLNGDVKASSDGGRTWRSVGNWVGAVAAQSAAVAPGGVQALPGREAGCSAPEPAGPGDPLEGPGPHPIGCDRPWLTADTRTGTLYVSFTVHTDPSGGAWETSFAGCRATVLVNPVFQCGRQYVSASRDGGRTWSAFHPFDSPQVPAGATGGFNGGPVARDGVLATAYVASGARLVFESSRDDGATWTRHVVPGGVSTAPIPRGDAEAVEGGDASALFEPYVASDPSRAGHYAVMVFDAAQERLLVSVTSDSGAHWSGPARLGEPGGVKRHMPWIAYGPTGALGVMWRTTYADGSYAAWAAVAPRGGTRFQEPVRLSSARSPGPVYQLAGDDASSVALDATALHAAWGDRRGGSLGIRYGRVGF
jgi:hypothetical protein